MLTFLAVAMLATLMGVLVSGRVSVIVGLILVPLTFAILGGFTDQIGEMTLAGISRLAPAGIMLGFAVLYFSVMSDAGLFDPAIRLVVRWAHGDPVRVVVGTAIMALIVSLDGDGATTYLICTSALLPLYRRLDLSSYVLTCIMILSVGITNLVPWGGPTARIAAALGLDVMDIFVPMIPSMVAAALFVLALSYRFGLQERARLGRIKEPSSRGDDVEPDLSFLERETARPHLAWFNIALTTVLMFALIAGILPLPILFMLAASVALAVNYPTPKQQMDRLRAHAQPMLNVMLIIFSVGILVGILNGTQMDSALAQSLIRVLPPELGPYLAPVNALISMPLTYFMGNSSYFYGVLPIIAETGRSYGIEPVEMARSVLIGQPLHLLSPMVASSMLLISLTGVEFGKHLRFSLKWSFVVSLVMLVVSVLQGVVPFVA